ncbi:MAG: Rv3654c family TadE-like protein [Candidatus Nanopelagicales bacterium]
MTGASQGRWGDTGAGVVLAVAATGVVLTGGLASAALVAGYVLHTRVDTAADLTAVAVAGRLLTDPEPCTAGAVVARANGADLAECSLSGAVATVTVTLPTPPVWQRIIRVGSVSGTSRAELVVE